jgi:hypothetical protein
MNHECVVMDMSFGHQGCDGQSGTRSTMSASVADACRTSRGIKCNGGKAYNTPVGHRFAKQSGTPAASAQTAAEKKTGRR